MTTLRKQPDMTGEFYVIRREAGTYWNGENTWTPHIAHARQIEALSEAERFGDIVDGEVVRVVWQEYGDDLTMYSFMARDERGTWQDITAQVAATGLGSSPIEHRKGRAND